ncbi:hypothetical protein [Flammeovirga agarivorans]|uniref:Uncharacterized protein n=1 Tax=Flammeovirga agarivorans TaxID=2726742 RepID=A0A7X8XX25_9BACT|nr:hypothetical protein [Flammeovirga agarivorans]NLR92794.1 hypothetical protein [Flammeovirga agarivorans]
MTLRFIFIFTFVMYSLIGVSQDLPTGTPFWLNSAQNPALAGTSINKGTAAFRYGFAKDGIDYVDAGGELGWMMKNENGLGAGINYHQIVYPLSNDISENGTVTYRNVSLPFSMIFRDRENAFSMGISLGYEQYALGNNIGVYSSQLSTTSNAIGNAPSYALNNQQEGKLDIGIGLSFFTHEHWVVSFSALHLQHIITSSSESLFHNSYPLINTYGQYIINNPHNAFGWVSTAGYTWNGNTQRIFLSTEFRMSIIQIGGGWTPYYSNNSFDHIGFVSSSVSIPFGETASLNRRGRIEKASDSISLKLVYYPSVATRTLIYPELELTLSANIGQGKYTEQLKKLCTLPRD